MAADAALACTLCDIEPPAPGKRLCRKCRAEQGKLLLLEAVGGGFCFVAVAVLLYLLGRWYAG